jgi:hypothetical protein
MGTKAAGQDAHVLDCCLASFAHHIGCAERSSERDPVRMTTQQDDLLCAKSSGGNHPAQANCPVADDRHALARANPCCECGVMACAHHVGQGEERRQQPIVNFRRQAEEGPVCLWDPHRFSLGSRDLKIAEEPAVDARGLQSFTAKDV